jgi:hypothetical protein
MDEDELKRHAACMAGLTNSYLGLNRRIILKSILQKYGVRCELGINESGYGPRGGGGEHGSCVK